MLVIVDLPCRHSGKLWNAADWICIAFLFNETTLDRVDYERQNILPTEVQFIQSLRINY